MAPRGTKRTIGETTPVAKAKAKAKGKAKAKSAPIRGQKTLAASFPAASGSELGDVPLSMGRSPSHTPSSPIRSEPYRDDDQTSVISHVPTLLTKEQVAGLDDIANLEDLKNATLAAAAAGQDAPPIAERAPSHLESQLESAVQTGKCPTRGGTIGNAWSREILANEGLRKEYQSIDNGPGLFAKQLSFRLNWARGKWDELKTQRTHTQEFAEVDHFEAENLTYEQLVAAYAGNEVASTNWANHCVDMAEKKQKFKNKLYLDWCPAAKIWKYLYIRRTYSHQNGSAPHLLNSMWKRQTSIFRYLLLSFSISLVLS